MKPVLAKRSAKEEIVGNQLSIPIVFWAFTVFSIFLPRLIPMQEVTRQRYWVFPVMLAGILVTLFRRYYYFYGVSESGFTEYFLGIRRRTIPWSQVRQIGRERQRGPYSSDPGVVVTLSGAPLFAYGQKNTHQGYYRNWPDVFVINSCKKCKDTIEKYYGKFDY